MKKAAIGKRGGVDVFTLILTIMSIIALMFILVELTVKYNSLSSTMGGAGRSASLILSAYDSADKALLYLDNAVGMSMDGAIYDLANNGFYLGGEPGSCGLNGGYVRWSRGSVGMVEGGGSCEAKTEGCVPGNYDKFGAYFEDALNRHIRAYNNAGEVKLIEGNYELHFGRPGEIKGGPCAEEGDGCFEGRNPGLMQVVGKAGKSISFGSGRVNYTVMPSFRENGDIDLAGHFEKITGGANGLLEAIENDAGISESGLSEIIGSYNSDENELEWSLDNYRKDCGGLCDTGVSCEACCCIDWSEEDACELTCEPGKSMQKYCDYDMDIIVKIRDDDYKKSDEKGYKAFLAANEGSPEAKEYAYRFSLNWDGVQQSTSCVPVSEDPVC